MQMAETTVARKAGEGKALWVLNGLYEVLASADETGGKLTAMRMTIPPGMGPPPHTHDGEETVFVISGEAHYHIGGETYEGGPGSFFYVPPGVEENFEPAGDTPLELLVLYTPGGIDRFFAEIGEPAEHRGVPEPTEPDLELVVRTAEQYGMRISVPAGH
jgi:quercetin dioxygenase-like cupin family protein